ncbi:MAG TPA: nidogen-like domain-containing protein [Solirubrobacterales bacterium]|jgi:hypothetical protein
MVRFRCALIVVFALVPSSLLVTPAAAKTRPQTAVASPAAASGREQSLAASPQLVAAGSVIGSSGCEANILPPNDDGYTGEVTLPFELDFFGQRYTSLWVNNNGNVTFGEPMSTYTPFEINADTPPIIAPFFADVDTRGAGSGLVTYGTTTFEGRQAFCVDWPNVGYYEEKMDKTDDFQLLLVERGDVAPGDFDIVFNYNRIEWETGEASGGVDGLGGTSAGAGYSNGDGLAGDFYQLPGSLVNGGLLDSNFATGLIHNDAGSTVPGRYVFHVTGAPSGGNGSGQLSRPWPAAGYGYSFANRGMSGYLRPSGLALGDVLTPQGLNEIFADWSRNTAASGGVAQSIAHLGRFMNGGLCFGLALTGGRFDALQEALFDPGSGRADGVWASAGTGPSATMNLPSPGGGGSTTVWDKQFLTLVGDDFLSQLSTQVDQSLQRQHYAFADPTSGVARLRAQLEGAMEEGHNLYDYSGLLSGPADTGFAAITIQLPSLGGYGYFGHEVLAFSAESQPNGDLDIDVWDNNFPGTYWTIVVHPNGAWTYNAPYPGGTFLTEFSLSGAPGRRLGLLAVLPLFRPAGLTYYPSATGGLGTGSLVDVAPEESLVSALDSGGAHVDIEPISADGEGNNGSVVDLPSDAGEVTVEGAEPSLDVRGEHSFMAGTSANSGSPVTFFTNEGEGEIEGDEANVELTVARGWRTVRTIGGGGLKFDKETVTATNLSGHLQVILEFMKGGSVATTTLFDGATAPGGDAVFTSAQLAAAEAEPSTSAPQSPGSTGSDSSTHGDGTLHTGYGKVSIAHSPLLLRHGKAKVRLTCSTAGPCVGHLRVTVPGGAISQRRDPHPSKASKAQVIGQASYSLAAGATGEVAIRLTGSGVDLLRLHHHVAVTVVDEPSVGTTAAAHLTLKAAAGK